jgi:hypothetical protein
MRPSIGGIHSSELASALTIGRTFFALPDSRFLEAV